MSACSASLGQVLVGWPSWRGSCAVPDLAWTRRRTRSVSTGPSTRRARPNARRRSARSRHPASGCRCAPRPGAPPRRSGTTTCAVGYPSATTRTRSVMLARRLQPTQVRTGVDRPWPLSCRPCSRSARDISLSLAEAPAGQRTRTRAECGLGNPVQRRRGGVGADVDPPAGEPRGEARVLTLFADRQGQLVVGDDHACGASRGVDDLDAVHPGRR